MGTPLQSRAMVLAARADACARNVAKAAEHVDEIKTAQHPAGVVVTRQGWLLLQAELQAWREATRRVVQAVAAERSR